MMKMTIWGVVAVIHLAFPAVSQNTSGDDELSPDFTLPQLEGDSQHQVCEEAPAQPAWLDELPPNEGYKIIVMLNLYRLRSYEEIIQTGDCSCLNRWPSWGEVEKEYNEQYASLPGEEIRGLQRSFQRAAIEARKSAKDICESQGNW